MLKSAILFVFAILFVHFIWHKYHGLDFMRHIFNHTPGPCKIIPGKGIGYEDMETLPNGLTLITSGLVFPPFSSGSKEYVRNLGTKGRIYLFDFNQPNKGIEELKIIGDQFNQSDFAPHGIGLWHDNKDKVIVSVVNHGSTGDTIEQFRFIAKDNQLLHLKTFRDPAIHFVNDVAMDSETSFYFTNYAYYMSHLLHTLEMLWPLRYGNLMYYDGKKFHKQDDGLVTANGLIVSHYKKFLYVFESVTKKFHSYRRHANGTVTEHQKVDLHTIPDNPTLDKDGNILVGAHPVGWKLLLHLDNPGVPAPSQVIKLHIRDGAVTKVTELLSDDGHTLHGSSVASMYKDGMLVGTVVHKLMYCQVLYAQQKDVEYL